MTAAKKYSWKSVRIFLSYSSTDREIAGELKENLEDFKMEVFLAHEDIEPTARWQREIFNNLENCDVFLPILTKNYPDSDWTDQEAGIAYAPDKLIIPLKVEINPYGFLNKYQALKFRVKRIRQICETIIQTIYKKRLESGHAVRDCIIHSLADSNSFQDAKQKSRLLLEFDKYTKAQLNQLIRVSTENSQIYQSYGAQDNLSILISKFKKQIDRELLNEYQGRVRRTKF